MIHLIAGPALDAVTCGVFVTFRRRTKPAMDHGECLQMVRRLLARPEECSDGFASIVRAVLRLSPHAAEEAARFEERVTGLSLAERQELFDETFTRERDPDVRRLLQLLECSVTPTGSAGETACLLARLAERLRRARNPYHHAFQAALELMPPDE